MKLKTLKDLNKYSPNGVKIVIIDELKAEALKWVKATKKDLMCPKPFIMHFFNISEEDLK